MEKTKLHELTKLGQSVWLDYIRRSLLESGDLKTYITQGLRGLTSNPAIFAEAITSGDSYDDQIQSLALEGKSTAEIYEALVISDIQKAADIFYPVYKQTGQQDGFVSLEVNPHLAYKSTETVAEAKRLANAVDRPNLMIKVPATAEGLIAIQNLIAQGYNINVTLMFSTTQYDLVSAAYMAGLEERAAQSYALDPVVSVASFFVSRMDVKVDQLLDEIASKDAQDLKGKIGIANAKWAYQRFKKMQASKRWQDLARQGARLQRVLFGSTSTKNPVYPDTLYVDNLIGPDTINTLPPDTLEAFMDHGTVAATIESDLDQAHFQLVRLAELGIKLDEITQDLLEEGVEKFIEPYDRLIKALAAKQAELITA